MEVTVTSDLALGLPKVGMVGLSDSGTTVMPSWYLTPNTSAVRGAFNAADGAIVCLSVSFGLKINYNIS